MVMVDSDIFLVQGVSKPTYIEHHYKYCYIRWIIIIIYIQVYKEHHTIIIIIGKSSTSWPISITLWQSSGWWLTHPSQKYQFVSWDDDIPNWMESHKIHVPTTNQIFPSTTLEVCLANLSPASRREMPRSQVHAHEANGHQSISWTLSWGKFYAEPYLLPLLGFNWDSGVYWYLRVFEWYFIGISMVFNGIWWFLHWYSTVPKCLYLYFDGNKGIRT